MMRRFAADLGISVPSSFDTAAAGIAGAILVATVALGWLIGSRVGPRLANLLDRHTGSRGEGIAGRMCAILRWLIIWIILKIAVEAYAWPLLASFVLGLGAALAAGLLTFNIIRGIPMNNWIAAPLAAFVFLVVLAGAVGGLAPITKPLASVGVTLGTNRITLLSIIQFALTVLALYAVARLAIRVLGQTIRRSHGLDPAQQVLAQKLAAIAVVAAAFFIGLDLLGIDLTALAVFSGAFGLAIGFGLQKTIGNLFAGILLLMDRSIKPGDVIVVGDSFGSVNKIGVRAVSIITRDGKEHLIPNEDLMTREVENWSYSTRDVRVHIPVGVAYDSDIILAQRLMIEAATASERVLAVPKPSVWLRGFGESSVDHEILCWIQDPEAGVGNVQSEILNRLWVLFKENGIELPFPQRDIRIKEWPSAPPTGGAAG